LWEISLLGADSGLALWIRLISEEHLWNGMRESSKSERTHLPPDSFEEWIKAQPVKPAGEKRARMPSENQYEAWVKKRVEKRIGKKQRDATS